MKFMVWTMDKMSKVALKYRKLPIVWLLILLPIYTIYAILACIVALVFVLIATIGTLLQGGTLTQCVEDFKNGLKLGKNM